MKIKKIPNVQTSHPHARGIVCCSVLLCHTTNCLHDCADVGVMCTGVLPVSRQDRDHALLYSRLPVAFKQNVSYTLCWCVPNILFSVKLKIAL